MKIDKKKRINVVSLTDWHVPFEDKKVIALEIEWCRLVQPDIIVLHELHDFYDLSKFDKDPKRQFRLQKEIDKVNVYLAKLRKVCPSARMILLDSNHLDRLRKFKWREAKGLNDLRALELKNLLELDKNDVEFRDIFVFKGFIFKHGDIVRKFSSYTAKGEFEKENCSGASGHTHRLGIFFHTTRGGTFTWIESGCGCSLRPGYIKGVPNWQNGFSFVSFEKTGKHFFAKVIPIINHQLRWEGSLLDNR